MTDLQKSVLNLICSALGIPKILNRHYNLRYKHAKYVMPIEATDRLDKFGRGKGQLLGRSRLPAVRRDIARKHKVHILTAAFAQRCFATKQRHPRQRRDGALVWVIRKTQARHLVSSRELSTRSWGKRSSRLLANLGMGSSRGLFPAGERFGSLQ
jgi:hypothetical protein